MRDAPANLPRRRLGKLSPVFRSLTLEPAPKHRLSMLHHRRRLWRPRKGAVDSGARNACPVPPRLATGRGRVHERLVLWLAAAVTCRRTTTESNRCSVVVLRTAVPGSHRMEHATPSSRITGCVEQSFLPEGTRARCVERGRAKPSLSKSTRILTSMVRLPDYPARVGSALHGVLSASAARASHGPGVFFRFRARASRV